jgi:trans-aconitate 2-methyltransferase
MSRYFLGMRWDPEQYAKFADERSRPFHDLVARIGAASPRRVVDLGCGQGELTRTLTARWPDAVVEGLDSSPEMIREAKALASEVAFSQADLRTWSSPADVDVIVSNAALQWVPDHRTLISDWAAGLPKDGWLAFQVPGNFEAPTHRLIRALAASPRWKALLDGTLRDPAMVETPSAYAQLMLDAGLDVDVWETTYVHVLHGPDPVLEWLRGTGLRPVLAALSAAEGEWFSATLGEQLRRQYPATPAGTLLPFRRIFAVGHRL